MRLKKWLAAVLLLLFIALLLHYLLFYTKLRFYRPVTISIKTVSVYDSTSIVQGITPYGRTYNYFYNKKNKNWQTGYVFLKDIVLTLDTSLLTERLVLTLNTGGVNHYFGKDELLDAWLLTGKKGSLLTFRAPPAFSDKSFAGSFLSIFRWRISLLILSFFIIICLILFLWVKWRGTVIVLPSIRRKGIIALIAIYILILWGIYTEFIRYKTHGIEGIGIGDALLFLIYIFFILHLIFEFIFVFWGTTLAYRQKFRILYISFFLMFLIAELTLRWLGIPSTYSEDVFGTYSQSNFKPPSNKYLVTKDLACLVLKKKEFAFYRRFNSEGLPDTEHRIEKDSSVFRVIALGDSFTEGEGTPIDSTWVNFLKCRTEAKYPDRRFEFFNAGISGSDPFFAYILLQDKLLKYKPDLVLLTINTTDISDYLYRNGFERFGKGDTVMYNHPPRWEWIYAYSYMARLFVHGVLGYDKHFVKVSSLREKTNNAMSALHEASLKFDSLGLKNNFKLVIILHPQFIETVKGNYIIDTFDNTFKNDTALIVADILDYFRSLNLCSREEALKYYWPIDRHHNAHGYKVFADGVFEFLKNNSVFDKQNEQ